MKKMRNMRVVGAMVGLLLGQALTIAGAQGTVEDYRRAERFLPWNSRPLVLNAELKPQWLGEADRFWYRKEAQQGAGFVLVDMKSGRQSPAFDHDRLAAALAKAAGSAFDARQLPFASFEFVDEQRAIRFDAAGSGWRCDLAVYECVKAQTPLARPADLAFSPDGRWAVRSKDHNLYLIETASGTETALTEDGQQDYDYGSRLDALVTADVVGHKRPPLVLFSPDSSKLLSYRLDLRRVGAQPMIQTVAGKRSELRSYRVPLPGDAEVPQSELVLFDVASKKRLQLDTPRLSTLFHPLLQNGSRYRKVWWNDAGTRLYFLEDERGYKAVRLHVADVQSGQSRLLFEERSDTYLNLDIMVAIVGDGSRIIWGSERDGWQHLYLLDGVKGGIIHRITKGEWLVRSIVRVDEKAQWIYFIGAGRERGRDPYFRHLYRVRFDGSGLQLLTPEDADHSVTLAPSGRYFTDTYSKADTVPVSVVRAAAGRSLQPVLTADISALQATGWKFPEPFRAKAQDGSTDIFGVIIRPSNFDPSRRYPVIDDVYPGPQHAKVFKAFAIDPASSQWAQSTAELGFIVVLIDGKGTPYRSRAFREASYGNMGDAGGLEDHIAVMKQLAARYPYMDLDRVGIYGNSGGGYATARALLKYPDFFKVGVAAAGNHDQRTYLAAWGERWQGYPPDQENYLAQANTTLASHLKGKLLLVHGDMDDNVNVGNTLQLANALIAANKDFDLLILPNRDHVFGDVTQPTQTLPWRFAYADPYFLRRRWDYFVKHLLGVEPPPYQIQTGAAP